MPVIERPRYDGHARWYDEWNRDNAAKHADVLRALLGPGHGVCLDLGCGTGLYLDTIRSTGRSVVGVDISADQLRVARTRGDALVQGDAAALPFAGRSFATVVAMWISTDVDDVAAVVREAARVLVPGGLFLFYGAHPCFNGPSVEWEEGGGRRVVHPTYRRAGWHEREPWWSGGGIRDRVGMRHVPLAHLLNAVVDAGLRLERVVEPGEGEQALPTVLAILARAAG